MVLSVKPFDNTLRWIVSRVDSNVKLPVIFGITGNTKSFTVRLLPHVSERSLYMLMSISEETGEEIIRKKAKTGLQYDIDGEVSLYFQSLFFNPFNLYDNQNIGTQIIYAYSVIVGS